MDELERLLDRLRADLTGLWSSQPVAPEALHELLGQAQRISAELRADLALAAQHARRPGPAWSDRVGLQAGLDDLLASWAAWESSLPRQRLRALADRIEAGRLSHKLPTKAARLEAVRQPVPAELRQAAERPDPPALAGPAPEEQDWLAWAWALDGAELERILTSLRAELPALAHLLEQGEPQWWQSASPPPPPAPVVEAQSLPSPPEASASRKAPSNNGTVPHEVAPVPPPPAPEPPPPPVPSRAPQPKPRAVPVLRSGGRAVSAPVPVPAPPPPPLQNLLGNDAGISLVAKQAPVAPPALAPAPEPAPAPEAPPAPLALVDLPDLAPVPDLPEEVRTFAAFSARYWVAPSGRCEPVPWLAPDFPARLDEAQRDALCRAADAPSWLGQLWAFARAAEQLQRPPFVSSAVVADFAAAWASPHSSHVGRGPERVARLRREVLDVLEGDSPDARLQTFLEAVRPSLEAPLSVADGEQLLELVPFHDTALRHVVRGLFKLGTHTADPVARLRAGRSTAPVSLEQHRQQLEKARKALYSESMRVMRAAGNGYVGKFPHCSKAWATFIDAITPRLKPLYPVDHQGAVEWDVDNVGRWIPSMLDLHAQIADRHEAREKARKIMDRAAHALADHLTAVNDALRQVQALQSPRHEQGGEHVPLEEVGKLLTGDPLSSPEEEICRQLLLRLIASPASPEHSALLPDEGPLALRAEVLLSHPDLVGLLGEAPDRSDQGGGERDEYRPNGDAHPVALGRWDALTDPLRAAAILLSREEGARLKDEAEGPASGGHSSSSASHSSQVAPLDQLARHLKRHKRFHLLGRLAARLSAEDQKVVYKQRNQSLDNLQRVVAELQQLWPELADLGARQAWALRPLLDEANRLASDQPSVQSIDLALAQAWVERVQREAHQVKAGTLNALRHAIFQSGEQVQERLRALDEGRYREVVRGPVTRTAERSWRETASREEAKRRFRHPRAELAAVSRSVGGNDLARDWTFNFAGGAMLNSYRKLRTAFAKWAFGGDGPASLYKKGDNSSPHEYRLPCKSIRDYLAAQQPTYLPQLADFADLVLLTPPVLPTDGSFVAKTADLIACQGSNALCVVLAPNLQPDYRRDLLKELRKRGAAAGALDDLDLCRLMSPGGRQPNLVIGLLEIAFEQQRWTRLSPFAAPEGTQVRMEMYVGRRQEAESLARTGKYTRLFSGRKLGKTALLKFLEQTLDNQELPSHLKLRVLYVPIVGVQTETDLVSRVIEQVQKRLDFRADDLTAAGHTPDALVRFLNRFIDERPDESLLFVLDEADEFVLAQLEEYEKSKERCLSFQIRSEVVHRTDSSQLSRVRFLFSGYRATSKRDGPWAHWGDVLHLGPLSPEEAADLIAGPLARLGIDASAQADSIAFRCGYQPAVLLRFGDALLQRLENRYGYSEGRTVSAEDVAETFHTPAVQDEVRMVVSYNFQGDFLGRAVFAALLLELARLPPGQPLSHADEAVLERLRQIDPDTSWLQADDNSARGQIAYQLSDFVKRQLLVEKQWHGETVHALMFPYHLSVLLVTDQELEVRNAIQSLRGSGGGGGARVGGLLPPRVRQDLHEIVGAAPEPGFEFRAAVLGSHWPQGVEQRSGGVPNRVGLDPSHVWPVAEALHPARRALPYLAALGASPDDLDALLRERLGGLAPPLVTGGADLLREVLQRMRGGDAAYEVCGLGRLSPAVLRWWFQRVRCLELPRDGDLNAIRQRTSGIPFLVRIVDELLVPPGKDGGQLGGCNLSPETMQDALAEFDRRLAAEAPLLVGGPPAVRLTAREVELLQMIYVASVAHGLAGEMAGQEVDLAASLGEEWAELYAEGWRQEFPALPVPKALRDGPEDEVALQMVQMLGLVPIDPDRPGLAARLRVLDRSDALLRLLPHLSVTG